MSAAPQRAGPAVPRRIYATAAEREAIARLAGEAGKTVSRYMVDCALRGEDDEDGQAAGEALTLSEDDQRGLLARAERLDRCSRALLAPLPGSSMSVLEGLAFLVEATRSEGRGAERGGS